MALPLLATKLYIPPVRRPGLLSRPRLVERLKVGAAGKLTLISAPAGFGKTTLLAEWQHALALTSIPSSIGRGEPGARARVAWLSLDEGDNDSVRFWRYVVAALQTIDASFGQVAQAALESSQPPPPEPLVTALINDVAAFSSPIILVLDDYHAIEAESIHTGLDFLLDHLPSQLHLVITSRADPPLSLARRRARRELTEIRTADLRFTTQEAAEFLNTYMGLGLSAEDVTALESRTEGWIVGLHLAALSLQGRTDKHDFVAAFAGDNRYIADYLVEEVLWRQPPPIQAFLLQTSMLDRLSGPLCDAVTGQGGSQAILEKLEQANLFIVPLDDRRCWYRYHHLFAGLLRQRLLQVGTQDLMPRLHRRASEWYEGEGLLDEAIAHALAAPDQEYAAALLNRYAMAMVARGESVIARSWLEALPESLLRSRPLLCVVYAWCTFLAPPHSLETPERWLREAEGALQALSPDEDKLGHDLVVASIATLRAFLAYNRGDDLRAVIALSSQALNAVPEEHRLFRSALVFNMAQAHQLMGDRAAADRAFAEARRIAEAGGSLHIALLTASIQADLARCRGRLRQAAAICREAMQSIAEPAERSGRLAPAVGALSIVLGGILLEWNDLAGAERALTSGLERIVLSGELGSQIEGYTWLIRLKQALGDAQAALDLIEQGERLEPFFASYFAAHRARLWLAQAESDPRCLAQAARWAQANHIKLDTKENISEIPLFRDPEPLILARLLIAQCREAPPARRQADLQPLLSFLEQQLHREEEAGWKGEVLRLLILQALALQAQGAVVGALGCLERALALAEPEGYVRIFVDEGVPMARLLYQAAERGIVPDYTGRLLAAFETGENKPLTPTPADPSVFVEPLSEREIEILGLVAQGFTNREIARQLVLSPGTVKVHTSHIYDKLDVHSRTQAVTKARVLGILPPT